MRDAERCLSLIFQTSKGYAAILYRLDPFALLRVFLPRQNRTRLISDMEQFQYCDSGSDEKGRRVAGSIADYFNGKMPEPPWPPWEWMDMRGLTPLQESVLKATAGVPYGGVATYGEIARAIGRPKAYRFVGNTLAKNPFPIMIPCHRIIRSNDDIGGFGGGIELKRELIALEQDRARHQTLK